MANCGTMVNGVSSDTGSQDDLKLSFVKGRLIFANNQIDGQAAAVVDIKTSEAPANNVEPIKQYKLPNLHSDIILGTFYQSNGSNVDGSEWCDHGTGDATKNFDLLNPLKANSEVTKSYVNKGIGPKSKCTFQYAAPTHDSFPVLQLQSSPAVEMQMHVLEWYNAASLTAEAVIKEDVAYSGVFKIAATNTQYSDGKGVYFNPILSAADTDMAASIPPI